jgi:hypothetical protein
MLHKYREGRHYAPRSLREPGFGSPLSLPKRKLPFLESSSDLCGAALTGESESGMECAARRSIIMTMDTKMNMTSAP